MKHTKLLFANLVLFTIVFGVTTSMQLYDTNDIIGVRYANHTPLEDSEVPNHELYELFKGYVKDTDGFIVRLASVNVKSTTGVDLGTAYTDLTGYYEIFVDNDYSGYTITASSPGYYDDYVTLSGSSIINFYLQCAFIRR